MKDKDIRPRDFTQALGNNQDLTDQALGLLDIAKQVLGEELAEKRIGDLREQIIAHVTEPEKLKDLVNQLEARMRSLGLNISPQAIFQALKEDDRETRETWDEAQSERTPFDDIQGRKNVEVLIEQLMQDGGLSNEEAWRRVAELGDMSEESLEQLKKKQKKRGGIFPFRRKGS